MSTPRRPGAFGYGGGAGSTLPRPRNRTSTSVSNAPSPTPPPPPPLSISGRSTPASALPRPGITSPPPSSAHVLGAPRSRTSVLPSMALARPPTSASTDSRRTSATGFLSPPPPVSPVRGSVPSFGSGSDTATPDASPSSVQVALRIRPITPQDATSIPTRWQRSVLFTQGSNTVSVDSSSGPRDGSAPIAPSQQQQKKQVFAYDHVLGPEANQEDVYERAVQSLIPSFVEGYNTTILA